MGFFSSKKTPVTQTQTTERGPWGGAEPYMANSMADVQRYSQGYQGPYTAGFTPWQNQGMQGMVNAANASPLPGQATAATSNALNFSNPFQPAMARYGNLSAGAGMQGLLDTAATGGQANPFLQPMLEANTAAQARAFAPALGRFSASMSGNAGDVGLRGQGGIQQEAGGQYVEDMMRGFGQANVGALNQSAENQAARQQDAIARLYGGGQGYIGTGAQTASDAERLRQGGIGLAPTAFNLGLAPSRVMLEAGNRQQELADLDIRRRMGQYNTEAGYGMDAARMYGNMGNTFGDVTQTQTEDRYNPSEGSLALGTLAGLGGMFLGGPGGAAVGKSIGGWLE